MTENSRQGDKPSGIIRREIRVILSRNRSPHTLEDREAGLVCARHSRALRRALVPSMGIRHPGRGADEGHLPTVFGEMVTRKVRPRLWSDWKDLEAAK